MMPGHKINSKLATAILSEEKVPNELFSVAVIDRKKSVNYP